MERYDDSILIFAYRLKLSNQASLSILKYSSCGEKTSWGGILDRVKIKNDQTTSWSRQIPDYDKLFLTCCTLGDYWSTLLILQS